jgi:hypothetical protein
MRVSRSVGAFLWLAIATCPVRADESQCAYQDLMPEFFALKERTATLDPTARARIFVRDFVPAHPEYYASEVFGDPAALLKDATRLFNPRKWPTVPGYPPLTEARMYETGGAVAELFARAQRRFTAEFPDFSCDTFVAFGPSLFSFDGRTYRGDDGRARLLFGMDMIALFHSTDDMPGFFQHELFHLYQSQVLGAAEPPDTLVWWALWNEGLATYVSHELNPELTAAQVFWYPRDLDVQVERNLAHWAAQLLAELEEAGGEHYQRWFDAGSSTDGPPPRAGYYLGYLLAQELARDRSLSELARLPPAGVRASAQRFLESKSVSARMQPSRKE